MYLCCSDIYTLLLTKQNANVAMAMPFMKQGHCCPKCKCLARPGFCTNRLAVWQAACCPAVKLQKWTREVSNGIKASCDLRGHALTP